MFTRYALVICALISLAVDASDCANEISPPQEKPYEKYEETLISVSKELKLIKENLTEHVDSTITLADSKTTKNTLTLNEKVTAIEVQLTKFSKELEALRVNGVNDSLDMNFSVWAGILLASVAVLVTTLGVVIAIGSVFGYKKIMDSSRKEAERVTKIELTKVAKNEIKERIERGEFNSLITDAVDRVAFGNINSNTELDDRKGEEK